MFRIQLRTREPFSLPKTVKYLTWNVKILQAFQIYFYIIISLFLKSFQKLLSSLLLEMKRKKESVIAGLQNIIRNMYIYWIDLGFEKSSEQIQYLRIKKILKYGPQKVENDNLNEFSSTNRDISRTALELGNLGLTCLFYRIQLIRNGFD